MIVAPTGQTSADTLLAASAAGYVRQDIPRSALTSGRTYLFSVFLKFDTATTTDIQISQGGLSATPETSTRAPTTVARLTWSAGVPTIVLLTSKGNGAHDVGVESIGDGWYRAWVALTFDDDQSKPRDEIGCWIYPDKGAGTGKVSAWGAMLEEVEVAGPDMTPEPTRYEQVATTFTPLVPVARRVLEIWPTPAADKVQSFRIFYRAKINKISDFTTEEIVIPSFMDDVYLETCRLFARGYHEEDEGLLHERLESLRRSTYFADAVDYYEGQQYELGPLSGCASESVEGTYMRNWNTGRVPMPNE